MLISFAFPAFRSEVPDYIFEEPVTVQISYKLLAKPIGYAFPEAILSLMMMPKFMREHPDVEPEEPQGGSSGQVVLTCLSPSSSICA